MKPSVWLLVLALGGALVAPTTRAQDLEPRSYTNIPIGETFMVLGYARSEGDLPPTPTSPLQDAELTIDTTVAGMAHSFALAGSSSKVEMVAARVCFEGSATFRGEMVDGQRCEYGDPRVKLTWNFYGAPALTLQDFSQWDEGLVVGTSLQLGVPVGTYSSDHLINGGTDRWMVRPSLGLSFRMGSWYVDAMTSMSFFEDNNNGFEGAKVEQDPIWAAQSHLIYNLKKGRWISLNANYFSGGENTINGVKADDKQENSRWGVTFSMPITSHHSIKLSASTGVLTRVGNDFDSYGIYWLYRF